MKTCTRCKCEKNKEEFIKDKRKKEGIGSICRRCDYERKDPKKENERKLKLYYKNHDENREYKRIWKKNHDENNREYAREKGRFYYHKNIEKNRERQNELAKNPERRKRLAEYTRKYRKEKGLFRKRANSLVEHALKIGHLIRPSKCERCLKECKPDGHHEDYNKPLEVQWLCKICHNHKHNKLMDIKP